MHTSAYDHMEKLMIFVVVVVVVLFCLFLCCCYFILFIHLFIFCLVIVHRDATPSLQAASWL